MHLNSCSFPCFLFLFQGNQPSLFRSIREVFLTRSVWVVQSQTKGQCYGNLPLYSLIVLWLKGESPPSSSFSTSLEGNESLVCANSRGHLRFWSCSKHEGGKTNTSLFFQIVFYLAVSVAQQTAGIPLLLHSDLGFDLWFDRLKWSGIKLKWKT